MKRLGIGALAVFLPALFFVAAHNLSSAATSPSKSHLVDGKAADAKIVPLFDANTKLEPDTIKDTPEALITIVADRVRDRHARENMFHIYDHFLPLYWEKRTVSIQVVDRVAKGGDTVTFNMTSLAPLNKPNLRCFFEGKGTVAQYTNNAISKQIDPLHYTLDVKYNTNEKRPVKIGDRIEIEFSPFLLPPVEGRTNYYGTVMLYVVGKPGMQPWEGKGPRRDSFPMPVEALAGGTITLHENNSDEPKPRYQQLATNAAPVSAQPFMLGRRLHHTDMGTGAHSEPENPIFKEQVGKLGAHYNGRSCVDCHYNNGRALPPEVGAPLLKYVIHVGADAKGRPHPDLGSTLQQKATEGKPEGTVCISSWTTIEGSYGDGSPFQLRKPNYKFSGVVPQFYSIRIAPPIIGVGLLEALDESTVSGLASAENKSIGISGHIRTVTDPETGDLRLGRYGWKAGQAKVKHQIASALNNDMGIPTSIYPTLDRGSNQAEMVAGKRIEDGDLDNMYRYLAVLGVNPRRHYGDTEIEKGETLFAAADCADCHTATLKTSSHHPLAELRNQTIHPYTDMLLHDMGDGLADNMGEGNATGAEWKTTPLWGVGLSAGVSGGESYLHDGRARTLNEAILWHGGEAEASKEKFRKMSESDRAALIKFLKSI